MNPQPVTPVLAKRHTLSHGPVATPTGARSSGA
jgi:hypothetical protein